LSLLLLVLLLFGADRPHAQSFPYNRDLVFDARPMPGSKRVPILTFDESGKMQIDLWCKRGEGQASMTDGMLKIAVGTMTDEAGCSPERLAADEEMLSALAAVTGIALDGDIVTLKGPKPLRFRAATN
jgi:heat shock protein HslJ